MIKRNIKMAVTSEESRQVQEICFANGIGWWKNCKELEYIDKPYLVIIGDRLYYNHGNQYYDYRESKYEEVDAKFFIRTNGSCIEENQEFKVGDIVGVYCPHPLCGYTNVKVIGVGVDDYILEADKDSTGHIPYQLRNKNFIVGKDKVFVSEYEQQFLLNKNIKEETMKENEVKSYADVKEYLIAKGLYERVLGIDWGYIEVKPKRFIDLFIWDNVEEGFDFWDNLDDELRALDINTKIESLVQDYEAKQDKEFIEYIEAKPLEKPKQYLCYVQGKALPKHIHKTLEQAKQEAQRLCRKELTKVRVLEVVVEYEAEVLVKEVL